MIKESKIRYGIRDGYGKFSSIHYLSTAHQIEWLHFKGFMFLEMFSKLIFLTLTIIYSLTHWKALNRRVSRPTQIGGTYTFVVKSENVR